MAKDRSTSRLFNLLAIVTAIAALYFAKAILLPLALAILLSFLLTPLCNRLERWHIPRILTALLVVGMSFAVLGVLMWVVTHQLVDLSRELPVHKANLMQKVRSIRPNSQVLQRATDTLKDLRNEFSNGAQTEKSGQPSGEDDDKQPADEKSVLVQLDTAPQTESDPPATTQISPAETLSETGELPKADSDKAVEVQLIAMPPSPLTQVQTWLGPLVAPLTTAGMVIVMVFFMLLDRENQRNRLIQLFGRSNLHRTTEAIRDASARVGRYLRMQFLINAGYGVAVALGLWLIGVPGAIMWGVLGFSLRFLPYIGPWLAAVLPISVSIATSVGWTQPLTVMGWYIVLELLLNNVAEPMLYGSSIGVSTFGVILAAIFWTWIWGPIGLILAMPMTVCLVVTARYVPQLRFITVLLADQPPLSPSERIYQRLLAFDYNESMKVAASHLKTKPLVEVYDEVVIPAIILAEQDRHAGLMNEDQEEFILEAAADLVEELGHAKHDSEEPAVHGDEPEVGARVSADGAAGEEVDFTAARILCIPLRDEADEIAARMLAQLLAAEGFEVEAEAAESLTSELVDRVSTSASDVVVISIMPPIAPRDSRLLWKRLRSRYPDLPIIVGFWNSPNSKDRLDPPENDAATKIVTTLSEAVTHVRSTTAQLLLADKERQQGTRTAG